MELNKIYCVDAYELIKGIPDNSIDLIITDPPYQMDEHGGGGSMIELFAREQSDGWDCWGDEV